MKAETLKDLTNQKAFDIIAAHLMVQGRPAMNGVDCVYRSSEGDKCAVGIIIPDELYNEDMEGEGYPTLTNHFKELKPVFANLTPLLMEELQDAHDLCNLRGRTWKEAVKEELHKIADDFNLDDSILDNDYDGLVHELMEVTNEEYQEQLVK